MGSSSNTQRVVRAYLRRRVQAGGWLQASSESLVLKSITAKLDAAQELGTSLKGHLGVMRKALYLGNPLRMGRISSVRLSNIRWNGRSVSANAKGTQDYLTQIMVTGGPKWTCSCPFFEKRGPSDPCKHILALADLWLKHTLDVAQKLNEQLDSLPHL